MGVAKRNGGGLVEAEMEVGAAAPGRPNNKNFKFRKLFLLQLLVCFRDFPLEIPLAHCVRGGMVRTSV